MRNVQPEHRVRSNESMAETNKRHLVVGIGVVAATILIVLGVKWFRDNSDSPWSLIAPAQSTAIVTSIVELRNKGQFDDAVNVGLHATSGGPDDDILYYTIATTYFVRSLHDKDHSGDWARLGAEYTQKQLDSNPRDIANIFNVGLDYVAAGDNLDTGGCEYYRRAKALFDGLAPRLAGDRSETQGRTVRLASFRRHNAEALLLVNSKLRRCQPRSN